MGLSSRLSGPAIGKRLNGVSRRADARFTSPCSFDDDAWASARRTTTPKQHTHRCIRTFSISCRHEFPLLMGGMIETPCIYDPKRPLPIVKLPIIYFKSFRRRNGHITAVICIPVRRCIGSDQIVMGHGRRQVHKANHFSFVHLPGPFCFLNSCAGDGWKTKAIHKDKCGFS